MRMIRKALVEAGDVAYLAETPEPTVSMAATVQKADETPQPTQTPVIVDGWELVWVDEFDAPSVDLEVWTEVDRRDNYNRELQYYTPVNSYIEDGCLYLTARDEEKDGKDYTSAMVETRDKLSFCYGRIEARIKLPVGKGLFPAFWLLSDNFEIDVMEMIGSEPEIIYGVNHYRRGSTMRKTYGTMISETPEEFHVYALEWNEDELLWYIDGELFYQTDEGVPDEEMYIIFTMAGRRYMARASEQRDRISLQHGGRLYQAVSAYIAHRLRSTDDGFYRGSHISQYGFAAFSFAQRIVHTQTSNEYHAGKRKKAQHTDSVL